jgi:hypothetical protein
MVNPLQSALSAALGGVRTATRDAANAAVQTQRATLSDPSAAGGSPDSLESSAPPELYAAVTQTLQARGRFSVSLAALKTADEMLAETVRLL